MVIPLFKPYIGYIDIEEGWQLKMSCVQVDWTLVFMVWMESHIEVWGVVVIGDTLCHAKSK